MEVFFITLILVLGLVIGSFLNVCIYRIAREESVAFPASHCTNCGYELKPRDLVPVVSYMFLSGKCRNCEDKISIKYPLVEILNGILYLLIYLNFGISIQLIKFCLLVSLLIVIGFIDFETKFVFRSTIVFGIILGGIFLIIDFITTKEIPWSNIAGAGIGFLAIWLIVFLTQGMGEGDIDIAVICGLFLGVKGIILTLFLAFIIGGLIGIVFLISKNKNRRDEMAFGPYLAIGSIIACLYGNELIEIYFKLFL